MNLYKIPQHSLYPKVVRAVIEIPRGTSAKYEYDPDIGIFVYDRSLLTAMTYPSNYGFIPNTLAEDGDALDILVYNSPLERGTVVDCKIVGVLDMDDEGQKDYKILGVPTSHIRPYLGIQDIDPLFLQISKNFFQHYKDLNDKTVNIYDWHDKDFAVEIVDKSLKTS